MGKRHPTPFAWQGRNFAANHRNDTNLTQHLLAVPLFIVAALVLLAGLLQPNLGNLLLGSIGLLAALAIQGQWHEREE